MEEGIKMTNYMMVMNILMSLLQSLHLPNHIKSHTQKKPWIMKLVSQIKSLSKPLTSYAPVQNTLHH